MVGRNDFTSEDLHSWFWACPKPTSNIQEKIGGHAVSQADSPWAVVFHASLSQSVLLSLTFAMQDLRAEVGLERLPAPYLHIACDQDSGVKFYVSQVLLKCYFC